MIRALLQRLQRMPINKAGADALDSAMHARRFTKRGKQIVVFGLGVFFVWAAIAPIDRGVTAPGWVIADGQRKTIQHLQGGIVDHIYVRDGDLVQEGQLLAQMNPINPAAKSESTGAAIDGLIISIQEKNAQLKTLNDQLSNLKSLASEGYIPNNRVLELTRQYHQLKDALANDKSRKAELEAQLPTALFDVANTEVRAPVTGYIVDLSVFTDGAVLQPGGRLMDVVPANNPLVVTGELPVHLIDRVKTGLDVELMFTAFNQNRTPHIPATLTMVAKDRSVDAKTGSPFYKIQAEATLEGLNLLSSHKVGAGMPVEVFIKTGERSLLSYLLKPLIDRTHSALRED